MNGESSGLGATRVLPVLRELRVILAVLVPRATEENPVLLAHRDFPALPAQEVLGEIQARSVLPETPVPEAAMDQGAMLVPRVSRVSRVSAGMWDPKVTRVVRARKETQVPWARQVRQALLARSVLRVI